MEVDAITEHNREMPRSANGVFPACVVATALLVAEPQETMGPRPVTGTTVVSASVEPAATGWPTLGSDRTARVALWMGVLVSVVAAMPLCPMTISKGTNYRPLCPIGTA